MSEEETIVRLRTFGLNLYESRAYLALLNRKPLTAKEVGQSTLIPQSRTYDVLESLRMKGFAVASPASPADFSPVPPAQALKSYYDSEKKKIQERATKVQQEAQARLDAVREAYLALTEQFPATGVEERAVADRIWVIRERENIENTLIGLIKDAKSDVLRITKPPEPGSKYPVDPFYILGMENQRFLYDALGRKVKMRWLGTTREIPTFLGLDIHEPPERRYLDRDEDITEKFLLVDNHSVLLNLHDPMSSTYGYVALAMQSKVVSSIFLDHFEKLWKKGRGLGDVLPRIRGLVDEVCSKMTEIGLSKTDAFLYRTLANSGAVTRDVLEQAMLRKKVQPQETFASSERLMRLGLLHRETALKVLMVEHPSRVRSSIAKGDLKFGHGGRITTRKSPGGNNY